MQISSEKPRYEGLNMAQNGLHFARISLDRPKFCLHQVCKWYELMLRCSDIISDLVAFQFAKVFCCFGILPGSKLA